jgi:hypothetical protein
MTDNPAATRTESPEADLILTNGRIATLDPAAPSATGLAIREGRFLEVGTEAEVVHCSNEFGSLAPPPLPVSSDWSPAASYGAGGTTAQAHNAHSCKSPAHGSTEKHDHTWIQGEAGLLSLGCSCFAF